MKCSASLRRGRPHVVHMSIHVMIWDYVLRWPPQTYRNSPPLSGLETGCECHRNTHRRSCACLSLNAGKWFECVNQICSFHSLPAPTEGEKLPVGTGSNPVYLVADNVIKIYVEGGLEASLFGLGTELEFYKLVSTVGCPLKDHIPNILGSGIICDDNGSYKILAWDGNGFPDGLSNCSIMMKNTNIMSPFGAWSRKLYEYDNARTQRSGSTRAAENIKTWPYVITKRCRGHILAERRESLSWEDALNLASFLGKQLHDLHLLPLPPLSDSTLSSIWQRMEISCAVKAIDVDKDDSRCATAWMLFLKSLEVRKEDVLNRLKKWGHPIPSSLIEKANTYLDDFEKFLLRNQYKACSWIHTDIMEDNIYMESQAQHTPDSCHKEIVSIERSIQNGGSTSWQPSYIIDFGNLTIGDPILDIIPIHLDVFRGDSRLLKQLLDSYKLPLWRTTSEHKPSENSMRLSYLAMCYCILHEDNVLGAIFSQWEELHDANSWEQVEERVWGDLNNYVGSA